MTAGLDQLDRLLDLPIDTICSDSVKAHESAIVEFNTKQLDRGLDSDGKDLGQYSSIKYKGRRRPIDLLLTGAYRGSFEVDPITGGFVMLAKDQKSAKLKEKYGDAIEGVPDQDLLEIAEWIKEDVIDEIRSEL